ncbi:MAG TPA: CYTH domain-containing protein [Hyphomicrobiaceae bacterium]|jgi:adenylate cyclase|nr:CYTH domain-containing protein [Hyphomicrobiaceae bacterium]
MAIEIERKFLLRSNAWRSLVNGRVRLRQAYLAQDGGFSTRIRIVDTNSATLTIKSRKAGLRRLEYEYPIPLTDAEALLSLRQGASIEKVRHHVPWHGLTWEIDVFEGENAGLVIAEIELGHEQQQFEMPAWIGAEITGDERYYNSRLTKQPFGMWTQPASLDVGQAN